MKIAIGVIARAPSAPGKTRLAADVPEPRLRALREAMLADTLAVVCSVRGVEVVVFATPEGSHAEILSLAPHPISIRGQSGADLGARMRHALSALIEDDVYDAALLVGTDAPLVTGEHLDEAIALLRTRGGVVIGPADDGGYYLIGIRNAEAAASDTTRVLDALFTGMQWGSDSVLMETMRIADRLRIDACLIRGAYDIDTIADLRRLERDLQNEPAAVAPFTRRVLGH